MADLLITEKMAIGLVKNGLREVSCGYEAEYEQTGEGEGRQFNIIGNHIALLEEGRAGQSYAINDHKGKGTMSKLAENMKKLFGKAVDEAMEKEAKDEEKPEEKEKAKDAGAYDELVKMVKDLGEKVAAMGKPAAKDEEKPEKKEEPEAKDEDKEKEEESKDEESSMEDRMKALETAVAKLLEMESKEESEDADEEEESENDDFEKSEMTGDTASRVEILSPGLKATKGIDVRVKALESAYGTKDGKAVLHALTGGKKPVYDSADKISTLFIAASEVLKSSRGTGLEKTKDSTAFKSIEGSPAVMTSDELNKINQAHWAQKAGK